jgi:hypothetical protein
MTWRNSYELTLDRWFQWNIGPLELFVRAREGEWVFAWINREDPISEAIVLGTPIDTPPDQSAASFVRYATRYERSTLALTARLADRAFVVRPELPLFLRAGEVADLFISTPVWVSCVLGEDKQVALIEVPSYRASDTWFGRDTCEGELCYATRTHAHTDVKFVVVRPHRASTRITIKNDGRDVLPIERIRVPVPALSLYQDADGRMWTDTLSLVREADETSAAMSITGVRHQLATGLTLLAAPRKPLEHGTIISAFSRFFA